MDLVDLYDRASTWTASKIPDCAERLEDPTPCDEWSVRSILNHIVAGHDVFQAGARGEQIAPPQGPPPEVISDDPAKQFEERRQETLRSFRAADPEKAQFIMNIAYIDTLIHGWDLAKATGQDTTMPPEVAEAAFGFASKGFSGEGAPGLFKPAVPVPEDASFQDRLLGLSGRTP